MSTCANSIRKNRFLRLGTALTIGAVAATGCASTAAGEGATAEGDPIIIGAAVALSGDLVSYDGPSMDTLRHYVEELNSKGGIDGQEVQLVEADTKSDPASGTVAAQQVLNQGADIVVVSCDFDYGSPAAIAAVAAEKIAFSLCAGSTLFGPEGIGELAFTMGSDTQAEAEAAAKWAYEEMSWRDVYMLRDDGNQYRKTYSDSFEAAWTKLGGTIAGVSTMESSDTSFTSQIAKIDATKPDAVVASVWEVGGPTALRQIRAAGLETPIISNVGMETSTWVDAVPGLKDFYFTRVASTVGDDPRPAVNDLYDQYKEEHGKDPSWSYAYLGYVLGQVVGAAIEGTDGDQSGEALAAWLSANPVETVIGPVTFTPELHLDQTRDWQIAVHEDGQTNYVHTVPYSSPSN